MTVLRCPFRSSIARLLTSFRYPTLFSFFSGLLIFSVFRREEGEEGSTIPKIKRKFIVRRVRVGMKHVVRRVARPNGKFILQNLLAFDLSCVEPAGFSFFFKREGIECIYLYCAMIRAESDRE